MSWESDIIRGLEGDVVVVPIVLARAIGLPAAAFLRQAAYLSAIVEKEDGWFFLEQEGTGDPAGNKIFQRLGSWQHALGLGPRAQSSIRKQLIGLGLLEERRGGMVHGKLRYRVSAAKYLDFVAQCSRDYVTNCINVQTAQSDCANAEERWHNQQIAGCTNDAQASDILQGRHYEVDVGGRYTNIAAAPRALGRGTATGAASAPGTEKIYNRRASGIITWLPDDPQKAEAIEHQYNQDVIAGAIEALAGKQPVPGQVLRKIEQLQRERDAAIRRAQEDAVLRERATLEVDPSAQAKGEKIRAAARKKLINRRPHFDHDKAVSNSKG
jgi:hypothetical protein